MAAYAAVVATAGLGWQVYLRSRQTKANVTVEVRHAGPFGPMMVETDETAQPTGRTPVHEEYELIVVVVNRGETTEAVEAIVLEPPADGGQRPRHPFWHHACNETLAPNGGFTKHVVPVSQLAQGASQGGHAFVARAHLVSGAQAESLPDEITPDFVRLSNQNRA